MKATQSYFVVGLLACLEVFSFHVLTASNALAADKKIDTKLLPPVQIIDPVVYVPLGTSQITTALFTIKNTGTSDISIIGITSPQVKNISLVPTPVKIRDVKAETGNTQSSSQKAADAWKVSAGQTLTLTSGRQYLQLSGLKNPLVSGDELQLEISLDNGKKLFVLAKAKSAYDQHHGH